MPLWTTQRSKPNTAQCQRIGSRRKDLEIISLPLGDFRHLTHIGSGGHSESFGDLSFLKEGQSLLQQSSRSEMNLFMACSLPPPPKKPPRINLEETIWEQTADEKRLKSTSMPLLDMEEEQDSMKTKQKQLSKLPSRSTEAKPQLKSTASCAEDMETSEEFGKLHLSLIPEKLRRTSSVSTEQSQESLEDQIESCLSFSLDLGPSILEEILKVMDKHKV
ncbi:hypothetical protein DNTS_022794 [Danionella cerebrum]|uniref:CRIB domain-containing protein n=1 Tax=Danionella cerebrum TaxID=2873325 RepID=A0A553MTP0_9TELE|nr:hypothetical protein DNTS_022794 [Danionella translucida]